MMLMDTVHILGVRFIATSQGYWHDANTVNFITRFPQYIADPDSLLMVAFPSMLLIDEVLALRFVFTMGTVDFVNNIMKWILQGQRPYWWVIENKGRLTSLPSLSHFELTCETGPGSPSGHTMIYTAIGYLVVKYILSKKYSSSNFNSAGKHRKISVVLWSSYVTVLVFLAWTRVHLASHFPHQVLIGLLAGLSLSHTLWNFASERLSSKAHFRIALTFLAVAHMVFHVLVWGHMDPGFTVGLALKYCKDKSYVKLTSSSWHAIYRNFGLLMGAGSIVGQKSLPNKQTSFGTRVLSFLGAIILAQIFAVYYKFATDLLSFPLNHLITVLTNALYVYCCLKVVTKFCRNLVNIQSCTVAMIDLNE